VIGGHMSLLPLAELIEGPRLVDAANDLIRTGRELNMCFGSEAAGTFGKR